MRVTVRSNYLRTVRHIQDSRTREAQATSKVASGKKFAKPSDDPTAAVETERSSSIIRELETYLDTASQSDGHLSSYENSLGSSLDILRRIHQLAIQLGNDTYNATDRAAAAEEVQTLHQALLGMANTQVDGRYIYSGNQSATAAFDANGVYQGDRGTRRVEIARGQHIDMNIIGEDAFVGQGGTGVNVFQAVNRIVTALQANDSTAVRTEIGNVVTGIDQLVEVQARVGGRLASISQLRETNEDERLRQSRVLTHTRDIDLHEAATELLSAQTGVQAALTATARMGRLSLLDLL